MTNPDSNSPETAVTATDVCGRYKPSDEARALLRDGMTPEAFFAALTDEGLFRDAVPFMANWLPKEQAIWWGALCAWELSREQTTPGIDEAFETVVKWLKDPTEQNRRAAEAAGKDLGMAVPAGAVAMAVFFSGGSMSRPGLPEATPPAGLTGKTVAVAVLMAARECNPKDVDNQIRMFLRLGLDVLAGKNRWDSN